MIYKVHIRFTRNCLSLSYKSTLSIVSSSEAIKHSVFLLLLACLCVFLILYNIFGKSMITLQTELRMHEPWTEIVTCEYFFFFENKPSNSSQQTFSTTYQPTCSQKSGQRGEQQGAKLVDVVNSTC